MSVRGQFLRFAVVGVVGLAVDGIVLFACLNWLGTGLYAGRAVSYLAAASTTWLLNRIFTFPEADRSGTARQWMRFVLLNGIGGVANYGMYSLVVTFGPPVAALPYLGILAGSVTGLTFNFWMSRRYAFGLRSGSGTGGV